MALKITIAGPKGSGKTAAAQQIKKLFDLLGADVHIVADSEYEMRYERPDSVMQRREVTIAMVVTPHY